MVNLKDYNQTYQNFNWAQVEESFSWHETNKINVAYEAIDYKVKKGLGDKIALKIFKEGQVDSYSYNYLAQQSNYLAAGLKKVGVNPGERIALYMETGVELYISILAAAKLGAIAVPLFSGYMTNVITDMLSDSRASAVITDSERRDKIADDYFGNLEQIIVVGSKKEEQDLSFDTIISKGQEECKETSFEPVWVDKESPLFLLYTSGSTGKPKGIVHAHGAMIHWYQTGKWVLDLRQEDIYWCTGEPTWITGLVYGVWTPWLIGVTPIVAVNELEPADYAAIIEKMDVTVWYTTPTIFRMLMSCEKKEVRKWKFYKLRHVASVGEPLNPVVYRWGLENLKIKIHDTWWMTETGGQIICNYPGFPIKPGSMGKPFPGIEAAVIDKNGNKVVPNTMGKLAIKAPWPGMMRAVWGNRKLYDEYFRLTPWYMTGDLAYEDEEGYFWYQGRKDDIINTAEGRIGPFKVESQLIEHPAVAEAGVIGVPDEIKGESIKAFVALNQGYHWSPELEQELKDFVREKIGVYSTPKEIEAKSKLPKTNTGKIMRRELKAWELGLIGNPQD